MTDKREDLETVVFHLTQLYHRLSQDRDQWAMTGGDLSEIIDLFKEEARRLSLFNTAIKEQMEEAVQDAVERTTIGLTKTFDQALQDLLMDQSEHLLKDLHRVSVQAQEILRAHQHEMAFTRTWTIALTLLSALIGGVISAGLMYLLRT